MNFQLEDNDEFDAFDETRSLKWVEQRDRLIINPIDENDSEEFLDFEEEW